MVTDKTICSISPQRGIGELVLVGVLFLTALATGLGHANERVSKPVPVRAGQ